MNEEDFPLMKHVDALKNKVRIFRVKKACNTCGSFLRECFEWNASGIGCHVCESDGASCKDTSLQLKNENKEKQKKLSELWCIPVAYGGYNTVRK